VPKKGYKQTEEHRRKLSKSVGNTKNAFKSGDQRGAATRFKSGQRPWNYKGEPIHLDNGYLRQSGGTKFVHTLIVEDALGRPLDPKKEMVHHINLDKTDNRNCNLLVCDHSYHRTIHHNMELAWVREHPSLEVSG
jgi:hypothetical protein